MANINLQSIKFNGLDNTYIIPTGGSSTDTKVSIAATAPSTYTNYYPTFHTATSGTSVTLGATDGLHLQLMQGTTSATGASVLRLGNASGSGTAGNKYGRLDLYSSSTGFGYITQTATTSTISHVLPATGGTILNTGTTSFTQTLTSGTEIGKLKINGTSYTLYAPSGSGGTSGSYLPLSGGTLTGAITIPNNVSYYVKNTSGTAISVASINTSNYIQLGVGASSRLLVGNSTNTPRIQISCSGRLDLLANGSTTDTTTDGKIGISINNDGLSGALTTLRPCQSGKASLGNASYPWGNLHCNNVRSAGDICFYPDGASTYAIVMDSTTGSGNTYSILRPSVSGYQSLGNSNYKWSSLYASSGTIQTSDINQKADIHTPDDVYYDLAENIEFVQYRFKNTAQTDGIGRIHIGAISQQVESVMSDLGLSGKDFAGFCKDNKTYEDEEGNTHIIEDEYNYSLRYDELAMLKIWYLEEKSKKQQTEINELKKLVAEKIA